MSTPKVIEVCPKCHQPYSKHGDVVLHCPKAKCANR